MGFICGIAGKRDAGVVNAMVHALKHRGEPVHRAGGPLFEVASSNPIGSAPCLYDGAPRNAEGRELAPEELGQYLVGLADATRIRLQGPFAAAACVDGGKRWLLVRDRLGRKPLYYYQAADHLLFASELKALLASGRVPKRLNLASVDRYLTLRCVPGPESIIQGVHRVPPGHALESDGGGINLVRFAGFDFRQEAQSRDTAAPRLLQLLTDSLGRTHAEGLLWSSGIDSAALGALAHAVPPLFVQLERGWQHEMRLARESARRLDLELKESTARRTTEETFLSAVRCLDEPIADASIIPLWLVIESASHHAPHLMSGHGADELLGGYPRFHFLQKALGARALVPVNLMSGILPSLPPNVLVRRGGRYLASIRDNFHRYLSLASVFDQDEREGLYTDAMKSALHERGNSMDLMRMHFGEADLTRNLLSLDLSVGLPDLLLAKCNSIAAAHGVTLEFPYLDDALVDFVLRLPPRVKFGVRSKPLLRLAMKGLLPGRVRLRARRDFRVPQDGRLAHVIENVARQTVTQERAESTGLFKWSYVDQVLRSATHNVYRRRQFWALLMFFAWYREIMES